MNKLGGWEVVSQLVSRGIGIYMSKIHTSIYTSLPTYLPFFKLSKADIESLGLFCFGQFIHGPFKDHPSIGYLELLLFPPLCVYIGR